MTATAATNNTSGRTKKAVVAAALGIALLAGGGGTFANWYENQNIASGTVTSGELGLATAGETWTVKAQDGTVSTIDPATYRMVPGDVVTYTANATTKLVGTTLKAKMQVLTNGVTIPAPYGVTTAVNGVSDATLTSANDGKTVPVTVTITLPWTAGGTNDLATQPGDGTAGEKDGTNQPVTIDLSTVKLSMVQVAA